MYCGGDDGCNEDCFGVFDGIFDGVLHGATIENTDCILISFIGNNLSAENCLAKRKFLA